MSPHLERERGNRQYFTITFTSMQPHMYIVIISMLHCLAVAITVLTIRLFLTG